MINVKDARKATKDKQTNNREARLNAINARIDNVSRSGSSETTLLLDTHSLGFIDEHDVRLLRKNGFKVTKNKLDIIVSWK